ncbi:MAG: radical SAM protein [Lachnospiraceae bacterium]|nr:radical SAM protein [Lachnospiraceae bacterium]
MFIPEYIKIDDQGERIVIHSNLDGTVIELTEKEYIEDFKRLRSGNTITNSKLIEVLKDNNVIIDYDAFKSISYRIRQHMDKSLILTILPTEGCNFRCTYCYEAHDNTRISETLMEEIVKYIMQEARIVKSIVVNWFGGEPTLEANLIIKYANIIKDIVKNNDVEYKASMTTNGYLLDEKMFRKFYDAGITNYQITLDGFEHDKKRVFENGQGTLTKILTNLRAIKKLPEEYKYTVVLRRNILKNENMEWYDFLAEGFADDKRFKLNIRKVSDFGGEGIESLDLLDGDAVLKKHIEYASRSFDLLDDDNTDQLYSKMCYAAYPKGFVICPDGTIEKCTVALHKEYNIVGKIVVGKGFYIDAAKNKMWSDAEISKRCMGCKSALSCNNMQCPRRRFSSETSAVCCE